MVKSAIFEGTCKPLISLIARIRGIDEYPPHHLIDFSAIQQLEQGMSDNFVHFPHLRVPRSKTAWLKRRQMCAKGKGVGSHTNGSTAPTSRSQPVMLVALLDYSHRHYDVKLVVAQSDSA